jgi:hypothetical protein
MKLVATLSTMAVLLAACDKPADRDTGAAYRQGSDTTVTKREMRDTTIVRHDTTISADTVRKHGTRPVKTDTVRKP